MKMTYFYYQNTKELISMRSIATRNLDALSILQSEEFKTLERIVTNEEYPITLFLTSICKNISSSGLINKSLILAEECADIF
jgi:hypothetical protein